MHLFSKLSKEEINRLNNGEPTMIRKLLAQEEKLIIDRLLLEDSKVQMLQGAGLWIRSLRKLIDPSGTTRQLPDSDQF